MKKAYEYFGLFDISPSGWIKEQMTQDLNNGFAGKLDLFCKEASSDIFGKNKVEGDGFSNWWNGETEGNWMDGLVRMAFELKDEKYIQKIKSYINNVMENIVDDGYIGVHKSHARYKNGARDGELWTQSRIYIVMLAYYVATGDKEIFNAVEKSARETIQHYTNGESTYFSIPDESGGKCHGLMITEPMLWLYDLTGDKCFIDFAVLCYEDYSKNPPIYPAADVCINSLIDESKFFWGHGPHASEHIRIPLMLYYYTGNKVYKKAYENAYKRIKMNLSISGSTVCNSSECIGCSKKHLAWLCEKHIEGEVAVLECIDPDKAELFLSQYKKNIISDQKGYPIPTAGYEYCSTTELLLSLNTAVCYIGDTQYADMAERLLYNAAQASRTFDGKAIGYLAADNQFEATKEMGVRWDYSSTQDDAAVCCVPNAVRIMPYSVSQMLLKEGDDTIVTNLYGPCKLDTTINNMNITIQEETLYPFDEMVVFKIQADCTFKLKLRVPDWSKGEIIHINNSKVDAHIENGFYIIERKWQNDDCVQVKFNAGIEILYSVDGTIAIKRASLIYSLKIPAEMTITKQYVLDDFYDADFKPLEHMEYTLLLGSEFKIVRKTSNNVWENSPISIITTALNKHSVKVEIELIPIGCTILRNTCFKYVRENSIKINSK